MASTAISRNLRRRRKTRRHRKRKQRRRARNPHAADATVIPDVDAENAIRQSVADIVAKAKESLTLNGPCSEATQDLFREAHTAIHNALKDHDIKMHDQLLLLEQWRANCVHDQPPRAVTVNLDVAAENAIRDELADIVAKAEESVTLNGPFTEATVCLFGQAHTVIHNAWEEHDINLHDKLVSLEQCRTDHLNRIYSGDGAASDTHPAKLSSDGTQTSNSANATDPVGADKKSTAADLKRPHGRTGLTTVVAPGGHAVYQVKEDSRSVDAPSSSADKEQKMVPPPSPVDVAGPNGTNAVCPDPPHVRAQDAARPAGRSTDSRRRATSSKLPRVIDCGADSESDETANSSNAAWEPNPDDDSIGSDSGPVVPLSKRPRRSSTTNYVSASSKDARRQRKKSTPAAAKPKSKKAVENGPAPAVAVAATSKDAPPQRDDSAPPPAVPKSKKAVANGSAPAVAVPTTSKDAPRQRDDSASPPADPESKTAVVNGSAPVVADSPPSPLQPSTDASHATNTNNVPASSNHVKRKPAAGQSGGSRGSSNVELSTSTGASFCGLQPSGVVGTKAVLFSDYMLDIFRELGVTGTHAGSNYKKKHMGVTGKNPCKTWKYVHIKVAQLREQYMSTFLDYLVFESHDMQERYEVSHYEPMELYDLIVSWLEDNSPTLIVFDRQMFYKFPVVAAVLQFWGIDYHIREGVIRTRTLPDGALSEKIWIVI